MTEREDGDGAERVAAALRLLYESREADRLAPLLAEDVAWGDDDNPRRCRGPHDVLRTLRMGAAAGAEAELHSVDVGAEGVLCDVTVRWPPGSGRPEAVRLFHVFVVRGGLVAEIRRYDDRASAAGAAGVAA
ncbi:MAG: nuclear transport factor 2 family protein [Acidimicrobiales bacterium]